MSKYTAHATRRNVDGKPDYEWTAQYSNGMPLKFDTEKAAFEYAQSACNVSFYAIVDPKAKECK